MANTLHAYPSDEELISLVKEYGTVANVASHLGLSISTLRTHVHRQGLVEKVAEVRRKRLERKPVEKPDEVSELDILRQRNAELEQAFRTDRKGTILEERILRRLEEGIQAAKPRYSPLTVPKRSRRDDHEFALLFSDTHASEVVNEEATLGMNRYDWGVMLTRMARLQKSVLSYQTNRPYPIRKLHVWMLGDMLSGDIHEELSQTNDRSAEEAAVQFGLDTAAWLEEFVPHFERISVVGVPGNHPRRSKKPSAKRPFNNADWTAYQVMRCYHRQNSVFEWDIPLADFATTTAAERWRVMLMHGDGIRSTMPGVPWGGVVRRITTLEQQFAQRKTPLDLVALGHFHQVASLTGVGTKTILNGSVKGLDEYSLKQFGSGRPPSQVLLTFHPQRGLTDISMIDLESVEPSGLRAVA